MKRFEIFKPGTYTAMDGRRVTITEADLAETARRYDPAKREAPLVVGHPKHDDPAFGWVKSLSFAAGLEAEPIQVEPAFAEAVQKGRLKKVSASFYSPTSPNNPEPGTWYLRHVGFLGAAQPAVPGLRPVEFGEAEEGVVEFAEDFETRGVLARLMRRLREHLIGTSGQEAADRTLPAWEVETLEDLARRPDDAAPEFAAPMEDPPMDKTITLTPAELDAKIQAAIAAAMGQKDAQFAEREKTLAGKERAARRKEIGDWLDGLVTAGKALPAWKAEGLAQFVESLDGLGDTVEFGEGDGKQAATPGAFFRGWLERLGAHPLFKEMTRPADETAAFAEGGGEPAECLTDRV